MKGFEGEADVSSRLVCNFREIGHTLRAVSEGKGSQKRILIILRRHGVITQSALTEKLGIQPGSASEVLGKLEAAGLIVRSPSTGDRRTTDIRLTPAGEEQAQEAAQRRMALQARMFDCLNTQEKETLLALLERVNESWDRLYRGESAQERGK